MRRGELFSLEWQDVCLTKKIITIRAVNAKSDRTRKIPLNAEALGLLLTWRNQSNSNQSGLVFPSPKSIDGEAPKRLDNIVKSWGKLIKDAAVQNFRFHDVRHTFASKLVMRGVDLNTVRELLGPR
jgi:integrase